MTIHRTLATLTVVPLALSLGVFACGGKIADDAPGDAAVTPTRGDGATPSPTGGSGSGTAPTTEPTPSGTGTSPTSSTTLTLDVTSCGARPETCSGDGGGYVTDIVDRWLARMVDECAHPKTGVPPSFPVCGTMYVKFHRPDGAGCVQTVKFSTPQTPAFAACMATALSSQRCVSGLFLTDPGDFDSRTFDLCAPH